MNVPLGVIAAAAKAYHSVLSGEASDEELHDDVDNLKAELRNFAAGRKKSLSPAAVTALANYAIDEGVQPEDPAIRADAEATLRFWREAYSLDLVLSGPVLSTRDLIAVRHDGRLAGGWLWLTERGPGRKERVGHHRLSSRAILAAVEVLLPHCRFRPFARGTDGAGFRPPAAVRFFHEAFGQIDDRVTLQDINTVLAKHSADLRHAHNAIFYPGES